MAGIPLGINGTSINSSLYLLAEKALCQRKANNIGSQQCYLFSVPAFSAGYRYGPPWAHQPKQPRSDGYVPTVVCPGCCVMDLPGGVLPRSTKMLSGGLIPLLLPHQPHHRHHHEINGPVTRTIAPEKQLHHHSQQYWITTTFKHIDLARV